MVEPLGHPGIWQPAQRAKEFSNLRIINEANWKLNLFLQHRSAGLAFALFVVTAANISLADFAWADGGQATGGKATGGKGVTNHPAQELIRQYCFDCHGAGQTEGNISLDGIGDSNGSESDRQLWWKVLKNVRAGVMPPPGMDRPTAEEQLVIGNWIKFQVFDIDAANLDPGRLPVRRLNRAEYENTINDLMGTRIDATLIFPADDSGHGFDNVGDALSFSPLLMEKYLEAARMVVGESVPTETKIVPLQLFRTGDFEYEDGRRANRDLDGKREHKVNREFKVEEAGTFQVDVGIKLHGSFDFDSAKYNAKFFIDGQEKFSREYGWDEAKLFEFHYNEPLEVGKHDLSYELTPIQPAASEEVIGSAGTFVRFEVAWSRVEGPVGTARLVHPRNYKRFFDRERPPESPKERRDYAAQVLGRFADQAYRSPVGQSTLTRLVDLAEVGYSSEGVSFEAGIANAMVAILTSPRFLFHLEATPDVQVDSVDQAIANFGSINELALASRLSYFLWSTLPDEKLIELAEQGRLRDQLPDQVSRMMKDRRSRQLLQNFVGQWLQTRDVIEKDVDPLMIVGAREEYEAMQADFRPGFRRGRAGRDPSDEVSPEEEKRRARFFELKEISESFNEDLRRAMQRETEMCVAHIVREDLSLLDLIDCDYTFLNQTLARHYGIDGVQGREMRKVSLPPESPRGGVLTQASMLLVTSNPTRTSPVKRGLFVLQNILGTPAPPAPPGIPALQAAAEQLGGREPTLRELLAVHRDSALCSSCHSRMDPIGLALENFNALGRWRNEEKGEAIDPAGELISGEKFAGIVELKKVLRQNHSIEFYRCVTQKMMTYALGRGVEYSDQHSIDLIVDDLVANDGKFSVLLNGVINSVPFQKQRLTP